MTRALKYEAYVVCVPSYEKISARRREERMGSAMGKPMRIILLLCLIPKEVQLKKENFDESVPRNTSSQVSRALPFASLATGNIYFKIMRY